MVDRTVGPGLAALGFGPRQADTHTLAKEGSWFQDYTPFASAPYRTLGKLRPGVVVNYLTGVSD